MPTASYNKFNPFLEAAFEKKHNLQTDSLVLWMSNTAPSSANAVLADITQITYTNLSSRAITVTSSSTSAGTYALILADLTLTASGSVGPFRYVGVYNDTAANDDLVGGWYDYGSSITLASADTFTVDFDAAGFFTAS